MSIFSFRELPKKSSGACSAAQLNTVSKKTVNVNHTEDFFNIGTIRHNFGS